MTKAEKSDSPEGSGASQASAPSGLAPNVAGALSYALGFVSGLIFLAIEKENKFVRFHAFQAIWFGVAWIVATTVVSFVLAQIPVLGSIASLVIYLGGLGLWVFLMLQAYQNKTFKLPIAGPAAAKSAGI